MLQEYKILTLSLNSYILASGRGIKVGASYWVEIKYAGAIFEQSILGTCLVHTFTDLTW